MTLSTAGTIALALVAIALLATLAFQFRPLAARGALLDLLGIVPRWKFFTHGRGTYDVAIDWRERGADGQPGAWRTIWTPLPRRRWGWLWRPDAFEEGIVWLAVHTLEQRIAAGKTARPETSSAYATILDLCRRNSAAGEGQFALIQTTPDGARSIQFTSTFHIC